jgi:hypothetical protein
MYLPMLSPSQSRCKTFPSLRRFLCTPSQSSPIPKPQHQGSPYLPSVTWGDFSLPELLICGILSVCLVLNVCSCTHHGSVCKLVISQGTWQLCTSKLPIQVRTVRVENERLDMIVSGRMQGWKMLTWPVAPFLWEPPVRWRLLLLGDTERVGRHNPTAWGSSRTRNSSRRGLG